MYKREFFCLFRQKLSNIFPLIFFFACVSVLLFTYRLGSLRVDKGQTPGLRDIGTYFSGGIALLQGENPYENFFFRIGPTGGLLFGVLASIAPAFIAATLVMAVSVFGFVLFVCTFSGYKDIKNFPWLFMGVLVFISSQRENLVNIQVTGLLALFAAIGFRLIENSTYLARILSVAFLTISVETKPHLLGLFILVKLIEQRRFARILAIFSFAVFSHLLISIYTGYVITLEWLSTILKLGRNASQDLLPERIAFDTFFKLAGISPSISALIMLIVFVSSSLALIFLSMNRNTYHLGLIIPSFGIFFHYYDLALAFGLLLTLMFKQGYFNFLFVSIGLFLIPQNFSSIQNIALILLLLMLLTKTVNDQESVGVMTLFFVGLCSWFIYIVIVQRISPVVEIHELSMSFAIMYSMVAGLILMFKKPNGPSILLNK